MKKLVLTGAVPSFGATQMLCKAAQEAQEPVEMTILGRIVVAHPGDSPHRLYDGLGMSGRGSVPEPLPITLAAVEKFCKSAVF